MNYVQWINGNIYIYSILSNALDVKQHDLLTRHIFFGKIKQKANYFAALSLILWLRTEFREWKTKAIFIIRIHITFETIPDLNYPVKSSHSNPSFRISVWSFLKFLLKISLHVIMIIIITMPEKKYSIKSRRK